VPEDFNDIVEPAAKESLDITIDRRPRLDSVPGVATHLSRRALMVIAAALWAGYPLARILDSWKLKALARPLEIVAATWIGMLFLLFATLLAADVFTLGGWLLPRLPPTIRGGAAIAAGVLSLIGLVQGLRPPVVRDHEVRLAGLPPERDECWSRFPICTSAQ
jgi:hypothetical protein